MRKREMNKDAEAERKGKEKIRKRIEKTTE